jgi:hypothetical protein
MSPFSPPKTERKGTSSLNNFCVFGTSEAHKVLSKDTSRPLHDAVSFCQRTNLLNCSRSYHARAIYSFIIARNLMSRVLLIFFTSFVTFTPPFVNHSALAYFLPQPQL